MLQRWLMVALAIGFVLYAYQWWNKMSEIRSVTLIQWEPEPPPVPPLVLTKPVPPASLGQSDAAIMPSAVPTFSDELALVNEDTLRIVAAMLARVNRDLETGTYGEPEQLSYNIVYLFRQSLAAYLRFLKDPTDGPEFHVMFHRPFSGRYQYGSGTIYMGSPTLGNGEGRFITTMFHEYQHYLFHTIYGTPRFTDISWKFYNELAAHMFEELFAAYLPRSYFRRAHRGGLPRHIKQLLTRQRGYEAIARIYDLMSPQTYGATPLYRFLLPARDGYMQRRELVLSISTDFNPDPIMARELEESARDYWRDNPSR